MEDSMASAPPVRNAEFWSERLNEAAASSARRDASSGQALIASCRRKKAVRVEERSAVYSKRYYHKKKHEVLSLKDQCQLWEDRNAALREDNRRLEELVKKALNVVASVSASVEVR